VQVDGQLRTGRDVVIAALLGAEEFGFAQAPMVVMGCIMMRACHLDTCPTGVATQNPALRDLFTGRPEHVANFFLLLAEEVREHLAALGFRSLQEAVGQAQVLDAEPAINHWKASGLDLTPVFTHPEPKPGSALYRVREQDHHLAAALDNTLIAAAAGVLNSASSLSASSSTASSSSDLPSSAASSSGAPSSGAPSSLPPADNVVSTDDSNPQNVRNLNASPSDAAVVIDSPVRNVNRSVGTLLGHAVTSAFGGAGLPENSIVVNLTGSAGQSLGAFLPPGITLRLTGDTNDYVGKGLSGGRIVVRPDPAAYLPVGYNVIGGNVIGYGATAGTVYLSGWVGERFGVRNSGATLVAEGVGDHACEYMTGGRVLILGPTGRNLGAGMSGGMAYILDLERKQVSASDLAHGELRLSGLDDDDWAYCLELLTDFQKETGSVLAADLLADAEDTRARLTKIVPVRWAAIRAAFANPDIDQQQLSDGPKWNQNLWQEMVAQTNA
jgi:glutamate synthase (NADPH/NADH) large chain